MRAAAPRYAVDSLGSHDLCSVGGQPPSTVMSPYVGTPAIS
jgi:hypothetical protein